MEEAEHTRKRRVVVIVGLSKVERTLSFELNEVGEQLERCLTQRQTHTQAAPFMLPSIGLILDQERLSGLAQARGWKRCAAQCSLLSALLGGSSSSFLGSGSRGSSRGRFAFDHSLAGNSLLLAEGVLCATCLSLGLKLFLAEDLGLGLVDLLNKHVLVLELVTLGLEVQLVVHLAVDLLLVSISAQETTEDTQAAHPQDLLGHASVPSTLSLTSALMTA